jgi:amino acid adenylation domain-containing protein
MEQDLAYIIYTSGSTGEPKGIMHTHASGLSYARMAADLYELTNDDVLSNFPPLHFDQSTFDYFSGPLVGATTVIIPEEHRLLPASLSQLMQDERMTVWYSVPFALIQLLLRGALEERDLSSLRWIIFGGEPFPVKYLRALQGLLPDAIFSNNYGPAETNQVMFYHVPPLDSDFDQQIPIGTLCPNMDCMVVDDNGEQVHLGDVGELLMRTPTMMDGYWDGADLNERAFFTQERTGGLRERYYRTGDLVQLRADGMYDFLGRKDRQIKTRGYRVELDEIESVLLLHPDVQEAGVFAIPNDEAGQLVHAAATA